MKRTAHSGGCSLAWAAFVLLGAGFLPAQAESGGLTLEQALHEAQEHNVEYRLTAAELARARAASREAQTSRRPLVMLETGYTRTTQPALVFSQILSQGALRPEHLDPARLNDPAAYDDFQGALAVRVPLWTGGRAGRQIGAAGEQVEAARASVEWARQVLRFRVVEAYVGALEAEAAVGVAQQTVEAAREHERVARDLVETGMAVRSDLLRAATRVAEARAALARAQAEARIARARLNLILGRPAEDATPLATTLEAVEASARAFGGSTGERPDLRAARAAAEGARLAWAAARRQRWPLLELQGRYESHGSDPFQSDAADWTAAVALRWTLADSGATAARASQARASYEAAALAQTGAQQRAELDLVSAEARVAAARTAREQAEAAVTASEEALAVVRDRYREGLATITELVDAEVALDRARHAVLAARAALVRALYAERLAQGGL